jgi:MATE family multidrug resistance protein
MERNGGLPENGSVKEVVRLAWPIVVSMLSYTAMGVTDTLFVGWVGKTELGAVGLATMAVFLVNAFALGVLEGVKVVSAQAAGAKDARTAEASAWQGTLLSLPLGAGVIALGLLHEPIFRLMGGTDGVRALAGDYFIIRVFSAPFWYVTMALSNAFQGMGDTRTPMRINLLANGLNIVLDPVFIFGWGPVPAMGVKGAALATVLACAIGMAYTLKLYAGRYGFRPCYDRRIMRSIVRLGWPMGVRFALDVGAWTAFTALLARMGEDELAANQIVINIIKLSFLPGWGISEAACILTGNYTGARDWAGVRRSFAAAAKVAVCFMAFCGLLFFIAPEVFLVCFQRDPEVLRIGRQLLWVAAVFQVFDAVAMVAVGALNGTGDTRYTMVVSVGASWFVLMPVAYLLGVVLEMGALGAWLGITTNILVVAVILVNRFRGEGWRVAAKAAPLRTGP